MHTANIIKRLILITGFAGIICTSEAQVGVGTANPNPSAQLDVAATNKGILIPRITLSGTNDVSTVASPALSLLVYNTNTAGTGATAVTPGYYLWDGSKWIRADGAGNTNWSTTGNYGTTSDNFIGTNDTQPLFFKINNEPAGMLSYTGVTFFGVHAGMANAGANNSALGYNALSSISNGSDNTAIGYFSMYQNGGGFQNTAVGSYSLEKNGTGNNNIGIGYKALNNNTSGSSNTALGYASLFNNTASENVALGSLSLFNNTIGNFNVAVGTNSSLNNTDGGANTAVGYKALYFNSTGNFNTAIGYSSGPATTSVAFSNTTAIGAAASITSSNSVVIGNPSVTSTGGYSNWSNLSDARFKTDIQPEIHGLDFILKLRPVTYHLNLKKLNQFLYADKADSLYSNRSFAEGATSKERITYTGFIAQEVEKAANETGYDFSGVQKPANDKDHYRLDYASFVVPLVKAVQEQQETINSLKKENTQLIQKQQALEQRLQRLEGLLNGKKG